MVKNKFKDFYYLCNKCGDIMFSIADEDKEKILQSSYLCKCGEVITMDNSFPNLSAISFLKTVDELYIQNMQTDKKNRSAIIEFLNNNYEMSIDATELDGYINLYEATLSKYKWNDKSTWTKRDDEFIKKLELKGLSGEEADSIFISIMGCWRNNYRTPFVIILGAFLEALFNDFFNAILIHRLGDKGANIFLEEYENVGIGRCIDISDAFLQKSLKEEVNLVEKNFFEHWEELRGLRNKIVHSNNQYISKNKINELYRLMINGINVFIKLKSKIINNTI